MKTTDILGVVLVVFDHNRGPYIALEKKNYAKDVLLKSQEQLQLIESISTKKYLPNDFLHITYKESSRYVHGRVYECKTKARSDLLFILLVVSSKVNQFDLKILSVAISEAITTIYPRGFTNITDGENFIIMFNTACQTSKKNELVLQSFSINLEQLKVLVSKYHLKDETMDILKNQFGD